MDLQLYFGVQAELILPPQLYFALGLIDCSEKPLLHFGASALAHMPFTAIETLAPHPSHSDRGLNGAGHPEVKAEFFDQLIS